MKIVKLTVFLAVVSALAAAVLSYVNDLTLPIIQEQGLAAEKANLKVIFPGGSFEEITLEEANDYVKSAYSAKDQGYAFKVETVGYNSGSPIQFMIGFDNDGNIVGFEVLSQQETNGLGSKVADPEFKGSVVGKTVNDTISTISGATVSSTAVIKGINAAKEIYAKVAGVDVSTDVPEPTPATKVTLSDDFKENNATLVSEENGVFTIDAKGFQGVNTFEITVADGKVTTVKMTAFNDTVGIGDLVNDTYFATLQGVDATSELDVVSGATYTTRSCLAAIQLALGGAKEEAPVNADEPSEAVYTDGTTVITSDKEGVFTVTAKGFQGDNTFEITVKDGAVSTVKMTTFNDTPGIGDAVNDAYFAKLAGLKTTEGAEVVSGATFTSNSALAAIKAVLDYIATQG